MHCSLLAFYTPGGIFFEIVDLDSNIDLDPSSTSSWRGDLRLISSHPNTRENISMIGVMRMLGYVSWCSLST